MHKIVDRLIFNPLFVIVVTVLVTAGIIGLRQNSKRLYLSEMNVKREVQDRDRVKAEVLELTAKIEQSNEPLVKDKLIRNELLHQKEGEIVIKLPTVKPIIEEELEEMEMENWQKWLELISPQFIGR